jgi:hypothetical protein
MMANKGGSGRSVRETAPIMDDGSGASGGRRTGIPALFHRFGGQLCGKPAGTVPGRAPLLGRVSDAQKLGVGFPFQIMSLREDDRFVTGSAHAATRPGLPVEFSTRVDRAAARGPARLDLAARG